MTAAKDYGEALFLLAEEDGLMAEVYADAECLLQVLKANPEYLKLLNTPAIPKEEREALIDKALAGISPNLKNLVKLMADRHGAHKLPEALAGFFEAYERNMGIERAEIISARPLTEEELAKLKNKLEEDSGKTVIIKNTIDPTLLGGAKLRFLGRELDGALKTRLESFERRLKNTVI